MAAEFGAYDGIFSVIMPVYNVGEYVEESLKSVLAQNIGFDKIRLIIINDGSTDNSGEICSAFAAKHPGNVIYIEKENGGVSSARNMGLDLARGKYITFLDSDDLWEHDVLSKVYAFFEKHYDEIDIVNIPLEHFDAKTGPHFTNFRFEKTGIVDIDEKPEFITQCCNSAFYKNEAAKKYRFDTGLHIAEDSHYTNRILLDKRRYGTVTECKYLYRIRFSGDSATQSVAQKKAMYTEKAERYSCEMIDFCLEKCGEVIPYIQHLLIYDLCNLLRIPNIPNNLLTPDETARLYAAVDRILSVIDDDVILAQTKISYFLKQYMLRLKHGFEYSYFNMRGNMLYTINGNAELMTSQFAWITDIRAMTGHIHISGFYYSLFDNENETDITVKLAGEEYTADRIACPPRNMTSLDRLCFICHAFELELPADIGNIEFYFNCGKCRVPLRLAYEQNTQLGVYTSMYMPTRDYIISRSPDFNALAVSPAGFLRRARFEARLCFRLLIQNKHYFFKVFPVRVLLFFILPLMKRRRVWIFCDRVDRAGDNGEALFRYAAGVKDSIRKYFVIGSDSPDFPRMKKVGKVLKYNSFAHKLRVLSAERLISAHSLESEAFSPFLGATQFYSGYMNFDRVFLQHGIIYNEHSAVLNKCMRRFRFFLTSAARERESILNGGYGYTRREVKLIGMPRYDRFGEFPREKTIVFAPTWDSRIVENQENGKRAYNPDFKNTDYFKALNDFLNDPQILDAARRYGYRILFRPHPCVCQQLSDFEKQDIVDFLPEDYPYRQLVDRCGIFITDYSSVFFDFVYNNRPVIYYRFGHLHYNSGYLDLRKEGFGETVDTLDALRPLLEEYLASGCRMKELYRERADRFFAFRDSNNCARAYKEILNLDLK